MRNRWFAGVSCPSKRLNNALAKIVAKDAATDTNEHVAKVVANVASEDIAADVSKVAAKDAKDMANHRSYTSIRRTIPLSACLNDYLGDSCGGCLGESLGRFQLAL